MSNPAHEQISNPMSSECKRDSDGRHSIGIVGRMESESSFIPRIPSPFQNYQHPHYVGWVQENRARILREHSLSQLEAVASEQFLRHLLNTSPDGLIRMDCLYFLTHGPRYAFHANAIAEFPQVRHLDVRGLKPRSVRLHADARLLSLRGWLGAFSAETKRRVQSTLERVIIDFHQVKSYAHTLDKTMCPKLQLVVFYTSVFVHREEFAKTMLSAILDPPFSGGLLHPIPLLCVRQKDVFVPIIPFMNLRHVYLLFQWAFVSYQTTISAHAVTQERDAQARVKRLKQDQDVQDAGEQAEMNTPIVKFVSHALFDNRLVSYIASFMDLSKQHVLSSVPGRGNLAHLNDTI